MDKDKLIAFVESKEGFPFIHQGRGPAGYDCVGLVLCGLADQGIIVDAPANYGRNPSYNLLLEEIERSGLVEQVPLSPLEKADLLVFTMDNAQGPQHVAVYIGQDQFIHAVSTSELIRYGSLGNFWRHRLTQVYRWL